MNTAYEYDIMSDYEQDVLEAQYFQDERPMPKTISELNLDDLMSEDYSVWIKKNSRFGFDVEISNDEQTYNDFAASGVHPYALEGLASFCRRFLQSYSRVASEVIS